MINVLKQLKNYFNPSNTKKHPLINGVKPKFFQQLATMNSSKFLQQVAYCQGHHGTKSISPLFAMTIEIKIEIWVYVGCDWVFVFVCIHMGLVVINFGSGFGYGGGLLWLVVVVAIASC